MRAPALLDPGPICLTCNVHPDALLAEAGKRRLYAANAGDARAVLCRGGNAIRLTKDHKASDPEEQERVTASGGWVSMNRVHGVLAVGGVRLEEGITACWCQGVGVVVGKMVVYVHVDVHAFDDIVPRCLPALSDRVCLCFLVVYSPSNLSRARSYTLSPSRPLPCVLLQTKALFLSAGCVCVSVGGRGFARKLLLTIPFMHERAARVFGRP